MRSLRIGAAAVAALSLVLATPANVAQARPTVAAANYLAAGDSITLGLGVPAASAYPRVIDAKTRTITLAGNVAASGATVATVAAQLAGYATANPTIASGITRITLTVGANDVGWVEALLGCINLPAGVQCADLVVPNTGGMTTRQLVEAALGKLSTSLPALLGGVRTLYPNATVYVGGYYELFGSRKKDCVVAAGYSISYANKTWYNAMIHQLNATIRASVAAAKAGGAKVRFVNVASVFDGHGFCDSAKRWVIGPQDIPVGWDLSAVGHPNVRGQHAYAIRFFSKGVR